MAGERREIGSAMEEQDSDEYLEMEENFYDIFAERERIAAVHNLHIFCYLQLQGTCAN